jgi:hypothetical protein
MIKPPVHDLPLPVIPVRKILSLTKSRGKFKSAGCPNTVEAKMISSAFAGADDSESQESMIIIDPSRYLNALIFGDMVRG